MPKGEEIDPFLLRLQGIHDQLTSMGSTPGPKFMVRTALNAVSKEWETFVQSILGRENLPDWEELWVDLRQEEIKWLTKARSSGKGAWFKKEEEEDAALASEEEEEKGPLQD